MVEGKKEIIDNVTGRFSDLNLVPVRVFGGVTLEEVAAGLDQAGLLDDMTEEDMNKFLEKTLKDVDTTVRNPQFEPLVKANGGIIGVDQEKFKAMVKKWGKPVADLVVEKKRECEEHNPSGCYPVPKLYDNGRKNSIGQAITALCPHPTPAQAPGERPSAQHHASSSTPSLGHSHHCRQTRTRRAARGGLGSGEASSVWDSEDTSDSDAEEGSSDWGSEEEEEEEEEAASQAVVPASGSYLSRRHLMSGEMWMAFLDCCALSQARRYLGCLEFILKTTLPGTNLGTLQSKRDGQAFVKAAGKAVGKLLEMKNRYGTAWNAFKDFVEGNNSKILARASKQGELIMGTEFRKDFQHWMMQGRQTTISKYTANRYCLGAGKVLMAVYPQGKIDTKEAGKVWVEERKHKLQAHVNGIASGGFYKQRKHETTGWYHLLTYLGFKK